MSDEEDRILNDEEALDLGLHPSPGYVGESEEDVQEYEEQIWDHILNEDPAPVTKDVAVDSKVFDCTFCQQVRHFTTQNRGEHAMNCPSQWASEELRNNTHCFRCGGPTQPEGGVRFFSVGEYGSTVFDADHDREYLLMFICDECLCRGQRKVLHWVKGQEGYREFDPGPQFQPRMPHVTIEATAEGGVRVFKKFGRFSQKGSQEEAEVLRGALVQAIEGLDAARDPGPDLSNRLQDLIRSLKPALDQDNIRSFSLADVPKIQDRVLEIEGEEPN